MNIMVGMDSILHSSRQEYLIALGCGEHPLSMTLPYPLVDKHQIAFSYSIFSHLSHRSLPCPFRPLFLSIPAEDQMAKEAHLWPFKISTFCHSSWTCFRSTLRGGGALCKIRSRVPCFIYLPPRDGKTRRCKKRESESKGERERESAREKKDVCFPSLKGSATELKEKKWMRWGIPLQAAPLSSPQLRIWKFSSAIAGHTHTCSVHCQGKQEGVCQKGHLWFQTPVLGLQTPNSPLVSVGMCVRIFDKNEKKKRWNAKEFHGFFQYFKWASVWARNSIYKGRKKNQHGGRKKDGHDNTNVFIVC